MFYALHRLLSDSSIQHDLKVIIELHDFAQHWSWDVTENFLWETIGLFSSIRKRSLPCDSGFSWNCGSYYLSIIGHWLFCKTDGLYFRVATYTLFCCSHFPLCYLNIWTKVILFCFEYKCSTILLTLLQCLQGCSIDCKYVIFSKYHKTFSSIQTNMIIHVLISTFQIQTGVNIWDSRVDVHLCFSTLQCVVWQHLISIIFRFFLICLSFHHKTALESFPLLFRALTAFRGLYRVGCGYL